MTPDAKALKKLAIACRKAGISHFKGEGFEFTLSDEDPKLAKKRQAATLPAIGGAFQSDSLTEDQLKFWSSDPHTSDTQ